MTSLTMNLRDLVILVADPSSYMSMLIHSMLRGFGTNKVLEVRNSNGVLQTLTTQKIDILICDARLPPHGGLQLTRAIRRKEDNENRTMPILIMTSDGANRRSSSRATPAPTWSSPSRCRRRAFTTGWPGSLSIRASSSTRRPISAGPALQDRRLSGRRRPPQGRQGSRDSERGRPRTCAETISTACLAPHAQDKIDAKETRIQTRGVFSVDTRFQQMARRGGGIPREQAIEPGAGGDRRGRRRIRQWLDTELQEIASLIESASTGGPTPDWLEAANFRSRQLRDVGTTMGFELLVVHGQFAVRFAGFDRQPAPNATWSRSSATSMP